MAARSLDSVYALIFIEPSGVKVREGPVVSRPGCPMALLRPVSGPSWDCESIADFIRVTLEKGPGCHRERPQAGLYRGVRI
jgi:hypothetical protein